MENWKTDEDKNYKKKKKKENPDGKTKKNELRKREYRALTIELVLKTVKG